MNAPPNYSTEDQLASTSFSSPRDPQISISPTADALHFQQGHLGIDDERPALEGEIQIKGAQGRVWDSLTLTLESRESSPSQTVQLDVRTITLFKQSNASAAPDEPPSSITFIIPLNPDTPQCIHTPHLDITHQLTAVLKPFGTGIPLIQSYVVAHTRRYTPRSPPPPLCPETLNISDPVPVEIQLPRRTYHSGEIIPIYFTIPAVSSEIIKAGVMLRNVSCQLRRIVSPSISRSLNSSYESLPSDEDDEPKTDELLSAPEKYAPLGDLHRDNNEDDNWRTTVAISGAACRFNETKAVKIRLLLRLPSADILQGAISSATVDSSASDSRDCGLISQSTLLGSVEFKLVASVGFLLVNTSRERVVSLSLPVTILPPQAPASEVDPSLDAAYRKKHDRPPLKTTRHPQAEEAGPSQAPPPFEDTDVPPPFTSSEANLNSHPPTFVESQADLSDVQVFTDQMQQSQQQTVLRFVPEGEGVEFGFHPSEEFDGTRNPNDQSSIPFQLQSEVPTEVPGQSLNRLLQVSRNPESMSSRTPLPPGIDDPTDPPPAIDQAYISAPNVEGNISLDPPPPPHSDEDPHPIRSTPPPVPSTDTANAAPPPYLSPTPTTEPRNSVIRPPPYVESNVDIEH